MAIKHFASLSLVILALATTLLAGQAEARGGLGGNLCRRADYPVICRSAVKRLSNPYAAMSSAIRQLIDETNKAKRLAAKLGSSGAGDVCRESYSDAIGNLQTCSVNLRRHDKSGLRINLSAALSAFGDCDDALSDYGRSPLSKTNQALNKMASNGLYLATLIH
ncbi:pectinesterase inhibitor-like [Juglans regia]|uniref:Pectinesterase inhibitor-like n=2 Tax=Juglans regia TaxID=51240 RepID=A0A2I4DS84_JUGRE|nr:pectinesterase inhibitor-like [Juglans regia]